MHDSNPFRKDTTDLQEEQILLEERLNFANDICEAVGLEPEELLEMLLDLVEAVEQLDELSPKTLASYINKAHDSAISAQANSDAALRNGVGSIFPYGAWRPSTRKQPKPNLTAYQAALVDKFHKSHKTMRNRSKGIRLASSNLRRAAGG